MRHKAIAISLTLLMLISSFVAVDRTAVAVTSGDYEYTLDSNGTMAKITAYYGSDLVVIIPDSIDGYPVAAIGSYAFYYSSSVTDVILPEGMIDIGYAAFYGCGDLKNVTLPESLQSIQYGAFYDCVSLRSIALPGDLKLIDGYAFFSCDLTTVSIPGTITEMGECVFQDCANLTTVTIGNGIKSIGNGEFAECYNLTSISMPQSVTSIGDGVFYGCRSLTTITIPQNVTSIGNSVFQGCSRLASATFYESITSIGYAAFYDCPSLTSISIPDNVSALGYGAFYNCTSLVSAKLGRDLAAIGALTFFNCRSLASVSVPDNVETIGYGAFFGCSDLAWAVIGSGVTDIGASAFGNCTSLLTIDFTSNAPSVGTSWLSDHGSDLTFYYRPGASGFTAPSWEGVQTQMVGSVLAAPRITGAVPGPNSALISWGALTGNGSEVIDYYVLFQDGIDVDHASSSTTVNVTGLVTGRTYEFQVAAHGPSGTGLNSSTASIVPYIGPGEVDVTISAPTAGTFLGSGDIQVNWTVTGDLSKLAYPTVKVDELSAVQLAASASYYQVSGLEEGLHSVTVTVMDVKGNANSATVTFTVDTIAPGINGYSPSGTGTSTRASIVVHFSERMNQTRTVIVPEGFIGTMTWSGSNATLVPVSTLIGNTTYGVAVSGADLAGNQLSGTSWTFTTSVVGTVSGTIVDGAGKPIANATVDLTGISISGEDATNASGRKQTALTDANGQYSFYDVMLGTYTLTSGKTGYVAINATVTMSDQGIAAGGLSFDGRMIAQDNAGDDTSMIVIAAGATMAIAILLAIVLVRRKR